MSPDAEKTTGKPRRIVLEGWCSLLVPAAWTAEQADGVTTLRRDGEQQGGGLNVSLYRRQQSGVPAQTELMKLSVKMARTLDPDATIAKVDMVQLAASPATRFEIVDASGDLWRVWHIADDERVICMAWIAHADSPEGDIETATQIVNSFMWDRGEMK